MEFATIKGREYAFVASRSVDNDRKGGLNVIDVDRPALDLRAAGLVGVRVVDEGLGGVCRGVV